MKYFKRTIAFLTAAVMSLMTVATVFAAENDTVKIKLSDTEITVDGKAISDDSSAAVYEGAEIVYYKEGTDSSYGEGTENNMHSAEEAAEHTVVTITEPGTYEISGTLSKGQLAVDLGEEAEDDENAVVTLILNGVDITCTVAPAVIFYNVYECGSSDTETATEEVDTSKAGARIIIADDSVNNINGSYVAKIYKEGTTKKLHKYDGAFYSKMSMEIDGGEKGNGVLNINAENEGMDSELHLTINGGNIHINSGDDGINTNEDGVSVTTINGGYLYIFAGNGSEGDGIDSNGFISINGGTVISLANPNSADSGIDSDMGTYINGGTVIGAGGMYDELEKDSKQLYMMLQFTEDTDEVIVVADKDDNPIFAYDFPYDYTYIVFSTPKLAEGEYYVYSGGTITGTETDGFYSSIVSYTGGTQMHHGGAMTMNNKMPGGDFGGNGSRPEPPEGFDKTAPENRPERPEGEMPPEMNNGEFLVERPEGMGGMGMRDMETSGETESYAFMLSFENRNFTNVSSAVIEKNEESDKNEASFKDVAESAWYKEAVDYVYSKGIMSGMSETEFQPETDMTRAMMVQILYKLSGEQSDKASTFTDVAGGEWYSDAIGWAQEKGIAGGYEDGTFRPEQKMTREEMSAFIYRYAGSPEVKNSSTSFKDADSISEYAADAIAWCAENGLISGMGDNTVQPKATATRAQLASITMRYMNL